VSLTRGTKGHSVLRKKTYVRKPLVEVEEFYPLTMPISRRHEVDSDYTTMGSFHNATGFANAVMDDSYDLQHQSRGRDHHLLKSMNNALHTDSPPTSPLSSRKSRISSQHKPRKSTRFDISGTESYKSSKLSDPLKTSKLSDPLKTSKLSDPLKASKMSDSLRSSKLSKISDSLRASKPLKLSVSASPEPPIVHKKYEPRKKAKPVESLELVKVPDSREKGKISGLDRMSPVVEHARSLLNRHRTFGKNTDLDNIATTAITMPRDLKSDFFSVSPLTNYIRNRWPGQEELPAIESIEEEPRPKRDLYKNPYLIDSDDEDIDYSTIKRPNRKTGDVLKELRGKKLSSDEDARGAYAISKYADDDDEGVVERPKHNKRYEIEDSPHDQAMSHLVSAAALRARAVLENLTGILGRGGMVNVEGDIKPYGGDVTTFRLHTPFHFQGPLMIGEKPAFSYGDDSFERYMIGLQEKRKEERNKVDKDAKRMTKLTRSLGSEPPKKYSLKPIGYISDDNYDTFSKSLVPYKTKYDKTVIAPSRKKVHFGEGDDDEEEVKKTPTAKLSRELVPYAPKSVEDEDMALVPKRRRYPVYEYTEEIPIKLSIEFPGADGEDKERLSVLEKIRIKALLVGEDKLDDPDRPRTRKPRSRYYADKVKKMENQEHLSSLMAIPTPHAISVRASSAPRKYRLDSRLDAEDLISKPSSYGKMRTQLTDVQDKMDHHRQLMDRYTGSEFDDVIDPLALKKADLGERITPHTDRADAGLATGGGLSATRTAKYKKRGVL